MLRLNLQLHKNKKMTQYDFDKLLEKYLQGACSLNEELLLNEWANRQLNHETTVLSEDETKVVKKRLWMRIKQSALPSTPLSIRWFSWAKLGIAASLVFVISIGVFWLQSNKTNNSDKPTGVVMTNTNDKPETITLNDGTTVSLQPNSTITFSEKFGDHNRIVYLKGEGFFKVKRDTTSPFYVYAGNLVTEVLGTSFTVKSYEKEKVSEVIVVSGKVMVYNAANTEGVLKKEIKPTILTPNQKVVFEKITQQIKPLVVEKPLVLNPPKSPTSFEFEETPLFEVLKKLENAYGLEILPNANLKDCIFNGDLNGLELYAQLDFICKVTNAQYEKQETKIIVKGEGCH